MPRDGKSESTTILNVAAEEALRESEQRLQAISDNLPNGAVYQLLGDEQGRRRFLYLSAGIERLFGVTPAEALADANVLYRLIHEADRARVAAAEEAARRELAPFDCEFRSWTRTGELRWFYCHSSPRCTSTGETAWEGIIMDVTDRKRAEAEIREADKRKDEFLATLAHELRNLLAPIPNVVHILKVEASTTPKLVWAREVIDRQVEQMARLLDDLLDISRISRGKLQLRKEHVELAEVVRRALESSRPHIAAMGHEVTLTLPKQPIVLEADASRLAQVFLNLIINAAKYMDRGGHIGLTAERQGSNVVVSVKDTGIGIPADQLPHIFEIFTQVNRFSEQSKGGLGIGLSLVKRLVEMHGGSVEARSAGPDQGSEFVVRLPVVVETSEQTVVNDAEGNPSVPSALRILIVDDNRDGADSLALMLRLAGNETHTAYDGAEAVALAEAFRPGVILLDLGLPKLSGYEACRHIRQQSWGKSMIIIAQTGWGQEEDRRCTQEAGFDHHLVKPIDPQALLKLLAELKTT